MLKLTNILPRKSRIYLIKTSHGKKYTVMRRGFRACCAETFATFSTSNFFFMQ